MHVYMVKVENYTQSGKQRHTGFDIRPNLSLWCNEGCAAAGLATMGSGIFILSVELCPKTEKKETAERQKSVCPPEDIYLPAISSWKDETQGQFNEGAGTRALVPG